MIGSLTKEQRNRAFLLGLCIAVALCVFLITGLKPFRLIELKMLDYRFQFRGDAATSNDSPGIIPCSVTPP